MQGRCTCGQVTYRLTDTPMFVHCCHCSWCQREAGSAFALNAMIESAKLDVSGETEVIDTPSNSGNGQSVHRCPTCKVALWSHYGGAGSAVAFVRVGTLDDPAQVTPDVHIYTSTKLPWVQIPEGAAVFEGYYNPKEVWPQEAQDRFRATLT